jgi:hypothetical protein
VSTPTNHGGTVTLTTATAASGGAALTPTISYRPNTGYYGTETFTVQVSDGVASTTKTFTVTVDAKPVVTATTSANAYTEQAAAVVVDSGITITDADNSGNGNWSGGTLKVQITANADSHDVLALPTVNGGGIWNNGGTIQNNLTAIGTLSSAAWSSAGSGQALTITFNGSATSADVQALARAVTFADPNSDPAGGTRTVTFTATDGSGASYNGGATRDLAFTLKNDAPTVTATATNSTFTEGGSAATLFSAANISTVEAAQSIQKMTLTVGSVVNGASEKLVIDGSDVSLTSGTSVTTTGGGSYSVAVAVDGGNVATVTITKSGNFTASAAQSLITGMTYKNTSTDPNTTDRTVTLTSAEDTGGGAVGDYTKSVTIADTVHVTAINNPPTLSSSGKSPSFTGTPVAIFGSTAISTVEAGQKITQLTMTVSNLLDGGSEVLVIDGSDVALTNGNAVSTTGGGIYSVAVAVDGSNTATVTITKAGNMVTTDLQTLVDGITYRDDAGTATTGNRIATLTSITDSGANGGGSVNATALSGITSTIAVPATPPVNAAGHITTPNAQAFHSSAQTAISGLSVADTTAEVVTVTVRTDQNAGLSGLLNFTASGKAQISAGADGSSSVTLQGTLTQINASLAGLTYTTAATADATDTVTISVDSDTNPNGYSAPVTNTTGAITINLHANDTPVLAGSTSGTVIDKSAHTIASFGTALSLTDTYNGGTVSATVSDTSGLLTIDTSTVTITGGSNGSTSVTFSGSAANVSAALGSLTYTDTYNGSTNSADTVTVSVDDQYTSGIAAGAPANLTATRSVAVTLTANDTPAVSVSSVAAQSLTDTAQHAMTGVSLSDTRSGTVVATVTAQRGNLNFAATNGDGNGATNAVIGTNDTNTVTITGTVGDVSATLNTLQYTTTATASGSDRITVAVSDGGGSLIGGALTDSKYFDVTLTANAVPTLSVTGSVASYSDNAWHTLAGGSIAAPVMADTTIGTVSATLSDLHGRLRIATVVGTGAIDSGNNSTSLQVHAANVADLNSTLANLEYATDATATGRETVTITVNDGRTTGIGGAKTATSTFEVALVGNDTPVVTGPPASVIIGDNQTYTISGFSFTDTYTGGTVTATVAGPNGILHLTEATGATVSNNDSASVSVTGDKTAVFNTIASFTYSSATEIVADTVTVTVDDGNSAGVGGAKAGKAAITINTAPNDIPDLTVPGGAVVTNDGAKSLTGPSFTDIYSGAPAKATISVQSGTINVLTGGGATVTNDGTKEVTVTGTVAQINAAIRTLSYRYATIGVAGSDVVKVVIDDQNVNGFGGNQVVTKTFAVTLNPPPVAAVIAAKVDTPTETPKATAPATLSDPGLQTVVRDGAGSSDKGADGLRTVVRDGSSSSSTGTTGAFSPVTAVASTSTAPAPSVTLTAALTTPSATFFQVAVAAKAAGAPDALVVNAPVRDAVISEGAKVSVTIPADAFAATKSDSTVTLAATRADGAALPGWMVFNPQTGTFEGTPPSGFKGEVVVKVTARDGEGHEAVQTFKIVVGEAGQGRVAPREGQPQQPQGEKPEGEPPQGGPGKQGMLKPAGKAGLAEQLHAMSREGRLAKQAAFIKALTRGGKAA